MTRFTSTADLQAIHSSEDSRTTPPPPTPSLIPLSGKAELIPTLKLPESLIIVAILEGLYPLADLHVPELPMTHLLAQGGALIAFLPISQLSDDAEIMTFTDGSITKGCEQMSPANRDASISSSRDKSTQNANTFVRRSTATKQTLACVEKATLKLKDFLRKTPVSSRSGLESSASNASFTHASKKAHDSPSA